MRFKSFFVENVNFTYDSKKFVTLPWNWNNLISNKIVNPLFYYAKENNDSKGSPEVLRDHEFSIITLPNLKSIPKNELSSTNITSGNKINMNDYFVFLKNPMAWYDDKIDQFYNGIAMTGKTPEFFGGADIRSNSKV